MTPETKIAFRGEEFDPDGYLSLGTVGNCFARIDGDAEKLCELHDKLGQLIAHRLYRAASSQSQDNPLNLADESAEITDRPF